MKKGHSQIAHRRGIPGMSAICGGTILRNKHAVRFAAVIMGTVLLAQTPWTSIKAEAAPPASGVWTLLPAASDEFDGTSLDTSKWNNGIWYDVTSALAFKQENVSVAGGNLVLTAKKESYNGRAYTAGAVESKFEIPGTASYVEVRARALDKRANVLSAVWMQSSPLTGILNPNPEIDIMETFNYSKMESTLHVWNISPDSHTQMGTNSFDTGVADVSGDYHTYGLERRDGKLRFYFDGKLAWEKTSAEDSFAELSRHMVLSLEGHLGQPNDAHLPGEFLIDYVRTYYYSDFAGVPGDGTYRIQNRNSGQYLDVSGSSLQDLAELVQSPSDNSDSQRWQLVSNGDGTHSFVNKASAKCVDLPADSRLSANGKKLIQYESNGGVNQKWYIVPTDGGYFKIISAISGKALCVLDASTQADAPVIQWTYENPADTNDEWIFVQ